MRVLKICTHPHGGAFIAARRQASGLNRADIMCAMVWIKVIDATKRTKPWVESLGDDFVINVPGSIWSYHGRMTQAATAGNRTAFSNTYFSFFPTRSRIDDMLLGICAEFNVIHFHWIAGMVSQTFLRRLKQLGKKIVVTSHDMNHFTGGCHYSAGCNKYASSCESCIQLRSDPIDLVPTSFAIKTDAFSSLDATWLFPSRWMQACFLKSKLGRGITSTKVLYNCIDTAKYIPLSEGARKAKRAELNIADNEMALVAGSVNNDEKRKGFRHLEAALRKLSGLLNNKTSEKRFVIITFGQGTPQLPTNSALIRHVHWGAVDENAVISLFQASDLFLMPSVEENFANTILESLHCGCPVLAFRIGGVPDIIEHGVNGWMVEEISKEAFATGLTLTCRDDTLAALRQRTIHWRKVNAKRFSSLEIARQLKNVYAATSAAPTTPGTTYEQELKTTLLVYDRLFGRCAPNNVSSHQVTAACLKRHVQRAYSSGDSEVLGRALEIPIIVKGFTELSQHPEQRLAGWQLQSCSVFFPFDRRQLPALCIQYFKNQGLGKPLQQIRRRLQIKVNGKHNPGHWISGEQDDAFQYLWIFPDHGELVSDQYNLVSFDCESPTVPIATDPRGLCARFSAINLFDLNALDGGMVAPVPDYELSTALSLRGGVEQYLWERWSEADHARNSATNDFRRWHDLLRSGG